MGFHKISGEWTKKEIKKKTTDEGETSRQISKVSPASPARSSSSIPEQPAQPAPSSLIQMNDEQMRKIANLVAEELRGNIKDEFAKLSKKL